MIYLIYGNDINKSRGRARELISSLRLKQPNASYVEIENEISEGIISEYLETQGLFYQNTLVLLDEVLLDLKSKEIFLKKVKEMADSKTVFVVLETKKIPIELMRQFKKVAKKIEEHSIGLQNKKIDFNNFSLADALGERNKKKLWLLYTEAIKKGVSGEEIVGILFWQLKSMFVVLSVKDIDESGLKPFVFSKNRRFAKNFTTDEIIKFILKLVDIYSQERAGGLKMKIGLEKFILNEI